MNKIKKIILISIAIILIIITTISISLYLYSKNKLDNAKIQDENIVFFGDSITEGYNVKEFFDEYRVVNSGISGNITKNLIDRIETDLYDYNPSKVIILIGTNDIRANISDEEIIDSLKEIINGIRKNRKNAEMYIQSIYPINRDIDKEYWKDVNSEYNNKHIIELNKLIKNLCKEEKINYINVYSKLIDDNGNLKSAYTKEGLHLNDLGYYKVTNVLKEYLKN